METDDKIVFKPGLTAHAMAKLLLDGPDLPLFYDDDGADVVPLKVEYEKIWAGEGSEPQDVPALRIKGASAFYRKNDVDTW